MIVLKKIAPKNPLWSSAFSDDLKSCNLSHAATIDKAGNIYFISDEANGEYNLYTLDNGKKKGLTKFSSSIKTPIVNANGGKIVFEKDYQLWLYDIKSDKESKLNVSIIRNNVLPKEKDFEVRGNIAAYDVSPDGKNCKHR